MLIVVTVTLDTVGQIQSHLIAHQYDGLIKKSKLRGGGDEYYINRPSGAGKGTQAVFIEEEFGLKQLSTGDMCRATMKEDTDLGHKVREIVEAGRPCPR